MADVDSLLESLSSTQLTEWMAFFQLEPFGSRADMAGSAIVASVIANTSVHQTKSSRKYKPEDFLPAEETGEDDPAEFFQALKKHLKGR